MIFFCLQQAAEGCGGETPLVKNKELLSKLDPAVIRKFEEKKLRYVRYLPDKSRGDYMNWQHVFFTENKEVMYTTSFPGSLISLPPPPLPFPAARVERGDLGKRLLCTHKQSTCEFDS